MCIEKTDWEKVVEFHGHSCPGLAVGFRIADIALDELAGMRAKDEELVAIVENDACGVDAIQYLTGCTFGKGNLLHKDYGKNAFAFYRRRDGKATRLVTRPTIYGDAGTRMGLLNRKRQAEGLSEEEERAWHETRAVISKRIMDSDIAEVFEFKAPDSPVPTKARIMASLTCENCGEPVMETRTRRFNDQVLCIPCFENLEKR